MLKKIFFIALVFLLQIQFLSAQNKSNNCDYVYACLLGEEDSKLSDISLYQMEWLVSFYTQAGCKALWYNAENEFANADLIRQILATYANREYNFHLKEIEVLYNEIQTFYLPMGLFEYAEATEFDILLSDAALQLAYNLTAKSSTDDNNLENDLIVALQEAIKTNKVRAFYENLKRGILPPLVKTNKKTTKNKKIVLAKNDTINIEKIDIAEAKKDLKDVNLAQIFEKKELEKLQILNEKLYLPKLTKEFYEKQNFSLVWQENQRQTQAIVKQIAKAEEEGLQKTDYHFSKINKIYLIENKLDVTAKTAAEQDILLTDAVLKYASHLFWGKIKADDLPFNWDIEREEKNMAKALKTALEENKMASFFEKQKPQHRYYRELKQALADYRKKEQTQDNGNTVVEGETLRLGMRDERVPALRKKLKLKKTSYNDYCRIFGLPTDSVFVTIDTLFTIKKELTITNFSSLDELVNLVDEMINEVDTDTLSSKEFVFYKNICFNPMLFDTLVQQAVFDFQKRNGLAADGIVGKKTLQSINISFADKIRQIEINLERWRWLPNDLGENYLLANIPTFMLYIFEKTDSLVLEKRTVVGKKNTQTPIFSDLMQYLDLNPYWTVPYSISTTELLPRLKKNKRYLASKNMELFASGKKVNPNNINWAKVNRSNFRYTIRQKPSKTNALGEVKFLFPNSYNVYVHDTPSKSLFANYERSYSHGCVRLEKPMELAEYLLQNNSKWTAEKLKKQLNRRKNKRIILDEPVPIYMLYLTAVSGKNGSIIFGNDIYKHDEPLMKVFYSEK